MIPTSFLNLPAPTRAKDHEAIRRAEMGRMLFGGPASSHGRVVNFNSPDTAVAKSSGMNGSVLDLYGPEITAEDAKRDEIARRMDALPPSIAALPKTHAGLGVDALEALAFIERAGRIMGGQPVSVTRGDLGRAIKTTPEQAEALIQQLESRNFLRRRATAGCLDYFTVHL